MPPPPHLSKTVRRLLKLALGLLVLAAAFCGGRVWVDSRGRALMPNLPARVAHARPNLPPQEESPGVPVSSLPVFAGIFSNDPAEQEAARTLQADLLQIYDLSTMYGAFFPKEGRIDSLRILDCLHIPVPQEMTQAQAAAEFLKWAERFGPHLAKFRAALALGKWDYGDAPYSATPDERRKAMQVSEVVGRTFLLIDAMIRASRLAGQPDLTLTLWKDVAALSGLKRAAVSKQSRDPADGCYRFWAPMSLVNEGISAGSWRDADLPVLARELEGADDPLTIYERNLGRAREAALAEIARSVKMPNLVANAMRRNPLDTMDPLKTVLHGLRSLCVTDTQISTNAAIIDRRYQVMEDSFNFRDRVYTPPLAEDTSIFKARTPTEDEDEDDFTDWYFSFSDRVGVHDRTESAIRAQNFVDMSRLALAVEIRKRATGAYPDSLDAVAASFPGGLPHDIATGQSYHYEKTPDGFFRIWGTGIDHIDNGGDPRKDTLLKLPKLR